MKIDVSHIAKLANLPLTDEEKKKFEQQLEDTLAYIKQLDEVKTDGVAITPQVTKLENILDEDKIDASLSQKDALKNATATHNGFIKVKAILEQ